MLDTTYQIIAGIVLLALITVAYGGTFVLSVMRGKVPANDLQKSFFRAGHAHAAVLLILGLVILILVQNNDVGQPLASLSTGVLWAAILMPAGFFLSVIGRDPKQPNRLIILLWLGAAVLTIGLLSAGIGLLVAA